MNDGFTVQLVHHAEENQRSAFFVRVENDKGKVLAEQADLQANYRTVQIDLEKMYKAVKALC